MISIHITNLTGYFVPSYFYYETGKIVEFCWIPSHVGVAGNERADETANRAAQAQSTRFLLLPARDSFSVCSTYARRKWQGKWENSGRSNLTRARVAVSATFAMVGGGQNDPPSNLKTRKARRPGDTAIDSS